MKTLSSKQLKQAIFWSDILSFTFGFLGVSFGILSVLALEPLWSSDKTIRDADSFALTATTISCDTLSVLSALMAYYFGTKLYNKLKHTHREEKPEIMRCERYSFRFDLWSFIFGVVGLLFGITSFVCLFPAFLNEYVSWWTTITSVCFDALSCSLVAAAMVYFQKGIKLAK